MLTAQKIIDARDQGFSILAMKEIQSRNSFSGMQEDFEAFAFPFETDIASLGWEVPARAAIDFNGEVPTVGMNPVLETVGQNLYLLLTQKMKGKALNSGKECAWAEWLGSATTALP